MAGNPCNIIPDQEIVLEGGAKLVPAPGAADAGKVLGVINQEGGIGWVEDQGGTLVQQQANWAETNDQSVSFIQNKPDLSVYATTSAMNTALAGKQDTINDLSDIRSGAAKGETAVQPSALNDYATTSAMNTALAGKQNTISDLDTIRSGASAGATAVQPSALESYATTSAMNTALAGKQDVINDLADIRAGAALGATAAQPSDLPSSVELVPSATSGDSGKVLTVDNQGTPSWVTPATVTVDQTYDAASSNAQSGAAVAQAIAAIPSSSYTAGDAIDITNNEISVDYDTNTLDVVGQTVTENVTQKSSSGLFLLPSSVAALLSQQDNTQVTVHIPANTLKDENFQIFDVGEVTYRLTLYATDSTSESSVSLFSTPIEYTLDTDNAVFTDQDIVFNLPASVANQWSQALSSAVAFNICGQRTSVPATPATLTVIGNLSTDPITFTFVDASVTKLAVKNPLPASTSADENKVLTVDSSGVPGWAPAASGAVPVLHTITCQENSVGVISGLLPNGEYLEPGLYQVFLTFSMSEYNSAYRHITFGYIVDGSDTIYGRIYYPVNIDSNGPFGNLMPMFMRTGYIQVGYPGEVNGIVVRFTNGTTTITGSSILNHLSLQYLKVADLS